MTRPEVLTHGDDGAGRGGGPGRATGAVVAVALLAVAGVAVARSRPDPADRPRPAASPTPTPSPLRTGWTDHPAGDGSPGTMSAPAFAEFVTVRRPPPGVLRAVLLPGGKPGFLVPGEDPAEEPVAVTAFGGPPHAQVVVGWCAATETFQDPDATYFYDRDGRSLVAAAGLDRHTVRRTPRDPLRLDIDTTALPAARVSDAPPQRRCPSRLYLPALPRPARGVHDTLEGHRVVRGRYVVTTETRAFCTRAADATCAAQGWETYGDGLPPQDLAGSYTWEGAFVVRGDTAGRLTVARLPGVRLVKRERVGVRAVRVQPERLVRDGGAARLRAVRTRDRRLVAYPLREDVELFLGQGVTGLGKPRATLRTFDRYLRDRGGGPPLWLVLDARAEVIRVVVSRVL